MDLVQGFPGGPVVCYGYCMSETESIKPRYYVRPLGERGGRYTPVGHQVIGQEHGAAVVDSWTGDTMTEHWAASPELASLVAETQASERNAPMMALEFVSKLAIWLDNIDPDAHTPGEVMEDTAKILEWHIGQLRGLVRTPLDAERLYHPADEFNR